jgi:hypothetical protein
MISPTTEREDPAIPQQQRTFRWQDLVEAQRRSGLDVTTFFRDRRIDRQRFYLWRQRFQKQTREAGAFLELVPSSRNEASGVRLRLEPVLSIEVDRGFDPGTLRQVVSALRA